MSFDPFARKKTAADRPHVVNASAQKCTQCGMDLAEIWLNPKSCDPASESAVKYRKELRDGAVGRAISR